MKKLLSWKILLVFVFVVLVGSVAGEHIAVAADDVTLTGTVSCSWCRGVHLRKAQTSMSCTNLCAARGASYSLIVGNHSYDLCGAVRTNSWTISVAEAQHELSEIRTLASLAGGRVRVTGYRAGSRINVASVGPEPKRD